MTDQEWAQVIRRGVSDGGVRRIILAVNRETATKGANMADVIVACAQMLGQSFAPESPGVAAEMRRGIMAMIDGFAMQLAVNAHESMERK